MVVCLMFKILELNEWFVLIVSLLGFGGFFVAPKIIQKSAILFSLMVGPFFGLVFDHTIAVPPFDLYDVGDGPNYEWLDLFTYLMYSPFGYFFIFFIEKYKLKGQLIIFYILGWTALGIGLEWLGGLANVYSYKDGYTLIYSIPTYLALQSVLYVLYKKFFK